MIDNLIQVISIQKGCKILYVGLPLLLVGIQMLKIKFWISIETLLINKLTSIQTLYTIQILPQFSPPTAAATELLIDPATTPPAFAFPRPLLFSLLPALGFAPPDEFLLEPSVSAANVPISAEIAVKRRCLRI
jgi:hypothetical protein